MWMNEYEVDDVVDRFTAEETPNLHRGAQILSRLRYWTNANSDGWPYWQKPANSASKLMDMLHAAEGNRRRGLSDVDITAAELTKALSPIKSFLTKQGVEHARILNDPPPPPPPPVEITVYLSGDNDGPDLFGVVYDNVDDAMESARENSSTAWSIKAMLYPASAVRLESDSEEDEEED
jgi:hypothetical protein